mmetsp:Transcript_18168/g.37862  ORF Transcript_18168/g.37862 Transcript_18168/m.37862 type:complete len:283 (-) Transcript_18168:208-1056(-)
MLESDLRIAFHSQLSWWLIGVKVGVPVVVGVVDTLNQWIDRWDGPELCTVELSIESAQSQAGPTAFKVGGERSKTLGEDGRAVFDNIFFIRDSRVGPWTAESGESVRFVAELFTSSGHTSLAKSSPWRILRAVSMNETLFELVNRCPVCGVSSLQEGSTPNVSLVEVDSTLTPHQRICFGCRIPKRDKMPSSCSPETPVNKVAPRSIGEEANFMMKSNNVTDIPLSDSDGGSSKAAARTLELVRLLELVQKYRNLRDNCVSEVDASVVEEKKTFGTTISCLA